MLKCEIDSPSFLWIKFWTMYPSFLWIKLQLRLGLTSVLSHYFAVQGSLSSARLRKRREARRLKSSEGTNIDFNVHSQTKNPGEVVNCWAPLSGPSFYVVMYWTLVSHSPPPAAKPNVWNDVYTHSK